MIQGTFDCTPSPIFFNVIHNVVAIPVNSNVSPSSHEASVEALKNLLSMASSKRQDSSPSHVHSIPTSHSEVAAQPSSHENQVAALKSLLLAKSPSPVTEQTPAPQSTQKNKQPKKKSQVKETSQEKTNHFSSPSNSSSESELASKNGSTKKPKKKSTVAASKSYFAGSAFQNSPDPTSIPLPEFDDLDDISLNKPTVSKVLTFSNVTLSTSTTVPQTDKSESLRRLLNIQRSA